MILNNLRRYAETRPRVIIPTRDGSSTYLERYHIAGAPFGVQGDKVFLHHFLRHDDEPSGVLHSHPFKWSFSLVLSGWYEEERMVLDASVNSEHWERITRSGHYTWKPRVVKRFNWLPGTAPHRISKLHGDVWTLFVCGPKTKGWGFYHPTGYVPYVEKGIPVD